MQITVFGAGYVGLVSAACLAELGHEVTIFDPQPDRLGPLEHGALPFYEPNLSELVAGGIQSKMLCPTSTPEAAVEHAELVMVCVGTPLSADGTADLRQIESVTAMLASTPHALPIVLRSTLPVGSTNEVISWLGRADDDNVVTNPEFLRQGSAVADFLAPTRVVIGTATGGMTLAAESLLTAYAGITAPLLITDYNSAEMIKNAANAFLAAKLSFINEVADLCEAYDANVDDVVAGMGLDPRIGSTYLQPGIGFGGSCLPKELANLVRLGDQRSITLPLMSGAAQTNEGRADRIASRIEEIAGPAAGLRVALLGLSFKPNTDDVRRSPSIALAQELLRRGARVTGHDPVVRHDAVDVAGLDRVETAEGVFDNADVVVLATDWPEYLDLDWGALAGRTRRPLVLDGRNTLDVPMLRTLGWTVVRIGQAAA